MDPACQMEWANVRRHQNVSPVKEANNMLIYTLAITVISKDINEDKIIICITLNQHKNVDKVIVFLKYIVY